MKLNEIISDIRSQKIKNLSLDDLKKNCSQSLKAYKKNRAIFKGMMNIETGNYFTDPKLKQRNSQNTSNYYTILMDNLPSWIGYPKRSQSLICSTSIITASYYHETFLVLPWDNAKIGVCPDVDLWDTKLNIVKKPCINDLNVYYKNIGASDKNFDSFISYCLRKKDYLVEQDPKIFRDLLYCKSHADIIKFFDKLYDPIKCRFYLTGIDKIPTQYESKEVWTDSPSYLIDVKSKLFLEYFK